MVSNKVYFIGLITLTFFFSTSVANNNGLGRVPLMGWNTWCTAGSCARDVCNDEEILEVAHALLDSGLHSIGYRNIGFDDCWCNDARNATTGKLYADPERFPRGMRAVIDDLHSLGFTASLYTSLGPATCNPSGRPNPIPGSYGNYALDAATLLIDFDADGIKGDWCMENHTSNKQQQSSEFYVAMNKTGKPGWFNFHCDSNFSVWCTQIGNSARISHDHFDAWEWTLSSIEALAIAAPHAGVVPLQDGGGFWWPDADLMTIGGEGCPVPVLPPITNYTQHCPGESDIEYRTEFTFWTLGSSLLLFATDPRNLTDIMKEVLFNTELIAVNQDIGAVPGVSRIKYQTCGANLPNQCELWHKTNSTGSHFVILFNSNDPNPNLPNATFLFNFNDIGLPSNTNIHVRDLWLHQDMGIFQNSYTASSIPPHGVVALQLT